MPRPRKLDIELTVTTKEAARLLDRRPQTHRKWACYGGGPIEPIRSHGRLLWALEDIERLRKFRNAERQKAQQKAQQRQKAASMEPLFFKAENRTLTSPLFSKTCRVSCER